MGNPFSSHRSKTDREQQQSAAVAPAASTRSVSTPNPSGEVKQITTAEIYDICAKTTLSLLRMEAPADIKKDTDNGQDPHDKLYPELDELASVVVAINQRDQVSAYMTLAASSAASKMTFQGFAGFARVIGVYDGDTITVAILPRQGQLPGGLTAASSISMPIRMLGYNSAELKTKDAAEKEKGVAARQFMVNMVLDKLVWVQFPAVKREDPYKRALARVYLLPDDIATGKATGDRVRIFLSEMNTAALVCVNDRMLETGHGMPYNGTGPKQF